MKTRNTFARLVLAFYMALVAAALIYTFFFSAADPQVLLKYQLAMLAMLGFGALTVRFPLKIRTGLSLSFITILLLVLLAEGILYHQSISLAQIRVRRAAQAGMPYDARSGPQVIADYRRAGERVVSIAPPSVLVPLEGFELDGNQRIFPLGGISHAKTVFCNESGEWITYLSDRYGFNNPDNVHDSPVIDIALIGDSYTHGICMPRGKDLASLLRASGYRAQNFGYIGNGALIELATLQEYASAYRPEIVLWIYYEENDLFSFLYEGRSEFLRQYLDPDFSQDLIHRQGLIDTFLKSYWEQRLASSNPVLLVKNHSICVVSLCTSRKLLGVYDSPPPPPEFGDIISEANDRVAAWGGTLYFVYLPAWRRYQAPFRPEIMYGREQVLELVAGLGIPVIDFDAELSALNNPLSQYPFQLPLHFNESGFMLLAQQILTRLESP